MIDRPKPRRYAPLAKEDLSDRAARELRTAILSGEYAPSRARSIDVPELLTNSAGEPEGRIGRGPWVGRFSKKDLRTRFADHQLLTN